MATTTPEERRGMQCSGLGLVLEDVVDTHPLKSPFGFAPDLN